MFKIRQIARPLFIVLIGWCCHPYLTWAGEVKVAVAANFTAPMRDIASAFEQATGHKVIISFGSTGKLYTQIEHGAPFEVFLAADQARPQRLIADNKARDPFTYAIGQLVLWSADPHFIETDGATTLAAGQFNKLAIANPNTAPYGVAALEVLTALNKLDALQDKLVRGDSITQTYQFIATKNAELGFVALSQVILANQGSYWQVPQSMYTPLLQDAVLLAAGFDNPIAHSFLDYLKQLPVQRIIEHYGYHVPSSS
jgi:molybdate transport system substrate-binding protein